MRPPPPFTPYPTADFLASPWLPNEQDQIRSQENWTARQPGVGFKQPQSFHSWILAYLKFALSVHLNEGWSKFGGFSEQLNFTSVILHLALVENPGTALIYARLTAARIEKLARDRDTRADSHQLLSSESAEFHANVVRENASGLEDVAKKKGELKKKKTDAKDYKAAVSPKNKHGRRPARRFNARNYRREYSRRRSHARSRSRRTAAPHRSRSEKRDTSPKNMQNKKIAEIS